MMVMGKADCFGPYVAGRYTLKAHIFILIHSITPLLNDNYSPLSILSPYFLHFALIVQLFGMLLNDIKYLRIFTYV
jgi:hypothetical protein